MSLEIQLASRWVNSESRKREAVRAAHEQNGTVLLELLNHYMTLKSARKSLVSDDTRRLYSLGVRKFLEQTNPTDIEQTRPDQLIKPSNPALGGGQRLELTRLEAEDLETWMIKLQHDGLSSGTITAYLNGVRALYRALIWARATERNPAGEVKPPRDPTPAHSKKSALSPAVFRDLIAAPSAKFEIGDPRRTRDTLLLALGGSAGLRAKEIIGLDVNDLELGLKRMAVRAGKGGKRRIVPLSKNLLELALSWLKVRKGLELRNEISSTETALLVSVSRNASGGRRLTTDGARYIAKGYYEQLGLPPELFGLHTLRRTAGTHLYRATRDLHVVADVLGHASVNTSAIYAKMDMEVRREALEAMESLREREK
jgi:integrase/recombinase XerC